MKARSLKVTLQKVQKLFFCLEIQNLSKLSLLGAKTGSGTLNNNGAQRAVKDKISRISLCLYAKTLKTRKLMLWDLMHGSGHLI